MSRDDRDETRRQAARRERRVAGDQSAKLATTLMKVAASTLDKLDLDEELRESIDKARAIPSQQARRRAERTLAGDLRRIDLVELHRKLQSIEATGTADTQLLHLAEQWRTRLVEEGLAAAETFPGGAVEPLPTLMANARRERDTGKPPGAGRALFRHVMATLQAQRSARAAEAEAEAASDVESDDDDEPDELDAEDESELESDDETDETDDKSA